jgi:hypothetical protein
MMRLLLLALALIGCGTSSPGGPVDPTADAPIADPDMLPTWQLEDVNPQSPRVGEFYSLVDAFPGKVVVVTLLEGF